MQPSTHKKLKKSLRDMLEVPPSRISCDPTKIINGRRRRRGQNPKIYAPLHTSKVFETTILSLRSLRNIGGARRRRFGQCRLNWSWRHGFLAILQRPNCQLCWKGRKKGTNFGTVSAKNCEQKQRLRAWTQLGFCLSQQRNMRA